MKLNQKKIWAVVGVSCVRKYLISKYKSSREVISDYEWEIYLTWVWQFNVYINERFKKVHEMNCVSSQYGLSAVHRLYCRAGVLVVFNKFRNLFTLKIGYLLRHWQCILSQRLRPPIAGIWPCQQYNRNKNAKQIKSILYTISLMQHEYITILSYPFTDNLYILIIRHQLVILLLNPFYSEIPTLQLRQSHCHVIT